MRGQGRPSYSTREAAQEDDKPQQENDLQTQYHENAPRPKFSTTTSVSPSSCIFATPEKHQKLDSAATAKFLNNNHLPLTLPATGFPAPSREGECTPMR